MSFQDNKNRPYKSNQAPAPSRGESKKIRLTLRQLMEVEIVGIDPSILQGFVPLIRVQDNRTLSLVFVPREDFREPSKVIGIDEFIKVQACPRIFDEVRKHVDTTKKAAPFLQMTKHLEANLGPEFRPTESFREEFFKTSVLEQNIESSLNKLKANIAIGADLTLKNFLLDQIIRSKSSFHEYILGLAKGRKIPFKDYLLVNGVVSEALNILCASTFNLLPRDKISSLLFKKDISKSIHLKYGDYKLGTYDSLVPYFPSFSPVIKMCDQIIDHRQALYLDNNDNTKNVLNETRVPLLMDNIRSYLVERISIPSIPEFLGITQTSVKEVVYALYRTYYMIYSSHIGLEKILLEWEENFTDFHPKAPNEIIGPLRKQFSDYREKTVVDPELKTAKISSGAFAKGLKLNFLDTSAQDKLLPRVNGGEEKTIHIEQKAEMNFDLIEFIGLPSLNSKPAIKYQISASTEEQYLKSLINGFEKTIKERKAIPRIALPEKPFGQIITMIGKNLDVSNFKVESKVMIVSNISSFLRSFNNIEVSLIAANKLLAISASEFGSDEILMFGEENNNFDAAIAAGF